MQAQFILEWKKQPWLLHLFWFLLLLAMVGTTAIRYEANPHKHGIGDGDSEHVRWAAGTVTSDRKFWSTTIARMTGDFKSDFDKSANSPQNRDYKQAGKTTSQQLLRGDYLGAITTEEAFLKKYPETRNRSYFLLGDFINAGGTAIEKDAAVSQYILKHKLNIFPGITEFSSVLNNFTVTLGLSGIGIFADQERTFCLIVLTMALTTFAMVFYRDRKNGTASMMRAAPITAGKQALIRWAATTLVLNLVLLLVAGLILAVMSTFPDRTWGTFAYPIAVDFMNKVIIVPLGRLLLEWLLVANLWFILIGSAAHLFSLFSRNTILGMALLATGVFLEPLNLSALIPAGLLRILPGHFIDFAAVVRHYREFSVVSLVNTSGTFLIWTAMFVFLAGILLHLRTRSSSALLATD